jgi:formylglycine-generating enzyme required for sulfatase activity
MAYPQSFEPLRVLNGRIDERTDKVIQRAMSLACDERWSDAEAMTAALRDRDIDSTLPSPTAHKTRTAKLPGANADETVWSLRSVGWRWSLVALPLLILLAVGLGVGFRFLALPFMPTTMPSIQPTLKPSTTRIRSIDEMTMVYVPAGKFQMGSTETQFQEAVNHCIDATYDQADCKRLYEHEKPTHTVAIDAFWLDQTEVSVRQFQQFVRANDYETKAEKEGGSWVYVDQVWKQLDDANWAHPQGLESQMNDNHPVVHVSWYDAATYCEWVGGRLPTEAEWEYAARGEERLIYPWGNVFDGTRLNYCDQNCPRYWADDGTDDGYESTSPVGSYPSGASWIGGLDMSGNVWEWVADWYQKDYYAKSSQENPTGPASGDYRVLRGGSWYHRGVDVRGANRLRYNPSNSGANIGFRCVVETLLENE